jgi:hypothetical protein
MFYPLSAPLAHGPIPATPTWVGCLAPGCSCRDARIVSTRKTAFFAALARGRGQTSDRAIAPDPTWSLTNLTSLERAIRTAP